MLQRRFQNVSSWQAIPHAQCKGKRSSDTSVHLVTGCHAEVQGEACLVRFQTVLVL